MPHTPHTPGAATGTPGQAHTPGGGNSGPPSVPPATDTSVSGPSSNNNSLQQPAESEIPSDLNFDPAAVIDGEGAGQEALNVRDKFYKKSLLLLQIYPTKHLSMLLTQISLTNNFNQKYR